MKVILKITTALMAVFLLCLSFGITAYASQPILVDIYTYENLKYTLSKSGEKYAVINSIDKDVVDLVIPETVNGHRVVDFESWVFKDCTKLESVTFPAGARFDRVSLERCENLKSVKISSENENYSCENLVLYNKDKTELIKLFKILDGNFKVRDSVSIIHDNAFKDQNLSKIELPRSVKSIGAGAFRGCLHLKSITLNCPITELKDRTFKDCRSLTELEIPSSVTVIGENVFDGCLSLGSLTLPGGIKEIHGPLLGTDKHCPKINRITVSGNSGNYVSDDGVLFSKDKTTLVAFPSARKGGYSVPKSVTKIADSAFAESQLESLTFNSSLSELGDRAFYNARSLKTSALPESITEIGKQAFWGCSELEKVHISANVKSISHDAFYNCDSMTLTVDANNENYRLENGCLYERSTSDLMYCSPTAVNCHIYTCVKDDWYFAFEDAKRLENITVDQSTELSAVNGVLYNKEKTSVFFIPPTKTEYTVLSTVEAMSSAAIKCFPDLKKLSVAPDNKYYHAENGVLFRTNNRFYDMLIRYPVGRSDAYYKLPSGCHGIGEYAFAGCTKLQNLVMHSTVEDIGLGAFEGCESLQYLRIPQDCTLLLSSTGGFSGPPTCYVHYVDYDTSRQPYVMERMLGSGCDSLKGIIFSTDKKHKLFKSVLHDGRSIPVQQFCLSEHSLDSKGGCTECAYNNTVRVESTTFSTIKMSRNFAYEYSLDGENWQRDNTFNGLKAFGVYTVYCRLADDALWGAESADVIEFTVITGQNIIIAVIIILLCAAAVIAARLVLKKRDKNK